MSDSLPDSRHPLATVVSPANLVTLARLLFSPVLFATVLAARDHSGFLGGPRRWAVHWPCPMWSTGA